MESIICERPSSPAHQSPRPPSPPLSLSKRRSNSTPSALHLILPPASLSLENIDRIEELHDSTGSSSPRHLSPPASPSKVNQLVESLASSIRSPLDSLKRKTKQRLKLSLKLNGSTSNGIHLPVRSLSISGTPTNSHEFELKWPGRSSSGSQPSSPSSSLSINPLTALINFIKPSHKMSSSDNISEICDLTTPPVSPLSYISLGDDFIIDPPSEFANDDNCEVTELLSIEEAYLQFINCDILQRPNITACYTKSGRIFYVNHDTKVTTWLPPPESWNTFQTSVGHLLNPALLHSSSSTSPVSSVLSSNATGNGIPSISPSTTNGSTEQQNAEQQLVDSLNQIKLPFGWELAEDTDGKKYFINHNNSSTTFQQPPPRDDEDEEDLEEPEEREVTIPYDAILGFGFVAGSEKPVVIRFVKGEGTALSQLEYGDELLEVNGNDVYLSPREVVLELIRKSGDEVTLKVCQPKSRNKKSNLLTAAKKARLRKNPPRVRFAEGVVVNGSPLFSSSMDIRSSTVYLPLSGGDWSPSESAATGYPTDMNIPFIPNVLKVFLENGQTKTFKYDSTTTVQSVLDSLFEKLSIKCGTFYGLICEQIRSMQRHKMMLLDPNEAVANVAARPNAHNLRCMFRVVYMLPDPFELLQKDPNSFEYLYQQCCNDIVHERYQPEIKYEIALRLSALRIYEHAIPNGFIEPKSGKVNIKKLDAEYGLDHFVPVSLFNSMKRKELIRVLAHSMKLNAATLTAPGQKSMTQLHCKVQFLKILSDLPCYGAKTFANSYQVLMLKNGKHGTFPNGHSTNGSTPPKLEIVTEHNHEVVVEPEPVNQQLLPFPGQPLANESTVLLSPKYGISFLSNTPLAPIPVVRLEDITTVKVTKNEDTCTQFNIQVYGTPAHNNALLMHPITDKSLKDRSLKEPLMYLTLESTEAQEFVLLVKGYHQLLGEINNNSSHNALRSSMGRSGARHNSPLQIIWEVTNDDWWNDGAPRYYGTHVVFGDKWNYPPNLAGGRNRFVVDLAIAPPHYSQLPASAHRNYPKSAMKCKSNPFSLSGVTEVIKSFDSRDSQLYSLDSTETASLRPQSIDMPSLVSMEILESHGSASTVDQNEVVMRVSEMNRILKDAEKYLNDCDTLERENSLKIKGGLEKVEKQKIEEPFPSTSSPNVPGSAGSTNSASVNTNMTTTTAIVHSEPSPQTSPIARSPLQMETHSSFAMQTAGSRISTLDMLPQLLQAETDLAEMARTLRTPPLSTASPATASEIPTIVTRDSTPSPHRLSNLIASLEAAQQQLSPDVIDLRTIPPPRTPERGTSPDVLQYLSLSPPASMTNQNIQVGYMLSIPEDQTFPAQLAKKQSLDTSRVVAELDNLCDTLYEMKSSRDPSPAKSSIKSALAPVKQLEKLKTENSKLLDNSLLFTFDQLTASINELIREDPNVPGSEFISKMVIPPPPPESPTLIKEQDEIIKRFWEATEDVKHMIATRKLQQQQRAQQQLALLRKQQKQLDMLTASGQKLQHFTDPPPYPTTGSSGGGLSSDSTAFNTSSDSESELPSGGFQFGSNEQYLQRNYVPYSVQYVNNLARQNQNSSLKHHQHQPKQPRSASAENVCTQEVLSRPSRLDLHGSPPNHYYQQGINPDAYARQLQHQLMTSHFVNNTNSSSGQPNQSMPQYLPTQTQLEGYNGNPYGSPQTTPPPVVRKLSNPQIDQMSVIFTQQPGQFMEPTKRLPQEMVYSNPFPQQQQQQPVKQLPSPAYPNLQQMLLNYHQHQNGLTFDPRTAQPMIRSQSLTLLPTGGHPALGLQPHSASTPPPQFPVSASPVDINSLLGFMNSGMPTSTNSSPTISSSVSTVIYTGNGSNGGRNSPRFPKPPIPPNSPSIKEKRRQQAILKSTGSIKEPSPSNGRTCVKSISPGSGSPELILVNYGGGSPNHPPPPYNSPHHQHHHHHHNGSSGATSSSGSGSNSSNSFSPELNALLASNGMGLGSPGTPPKLMPNDISSPTNSSSVSFFQMSTSGSSQTGDQYFLPGMGSTIVMNNGETTSDSPSGTVNINPSLYASIPESKRICFQTKEMEEIFNQSQYDIDTLLARLEEIHESRLRQTGSRHDSHGKDGSPSSARETLIVESRHFVTASKFFVKCATEGSFQLIDYLTECITLLERMFHASETMIFEMESGAQVTCLVDRLKEVAATYAYTVDTVRRLVGFSPDEEVQHQLPVEVIGGKRQNPFLDLLMNHATSLATCLSTLMRTLRTMN